MPSSYAIKLRAYQRLVEKPYFYDHWREAAEEWDKDRWPNFKAEKLACPLSQQLYLDPYSLDCLQSARHVIQKPFIINSAHRSIEHNKDVGGRPNSAHLQIAFDISLHKHDRNQLRRVLGNCGFTRFGLYQTFIHVDTRPHKATWYGKGAKEIWNHKRLST